MKTDLSFEHTDTKKLLSKMGFEYFMKQHLSTEKYNQIDIDNIYKSYKTTSLQLKNRQKENRAQFYFFCEGQVRKMFTGGFLPSLFGLNETRRQTFIDFPAVGESWAYFKVWQKHYKRKMTLEKTWDVIVKSGSVLAILLSIIKVLEYLKTK